MQSPVHQMISMTEVQPILPQLFQREGVTPVRLGTTHIAVVIVPWRLYLHWWTAFWQVKEYVLIEEMRNATEMRAMFSSYSKKLAPLLASDKQTLRVVVVKIHKREVGAVLAWPDWMLFTPGDFPERRSSPALEDRTLTIVFAHKHLSQLATQFAEEEKRGERKAITVTKQGQPIMAILPWTLYQQWQRSIAEHLPDGTPDAE